MESQSQLQVSNSHQQSGGTTFLKTCFNGLNSVLGVGILSMPYAVSQGGWLSLILLFLFAMISWYTALLLQRCMNGHPLIKSYPDIGQVAFGYKGKALIAIIIYIELFLIAVELLILEGDNLEKLFPNVSFTIAGLRIGGKRGFVMLAALVILPTTWLRSLGVLAYVSVGGILASIILLGCVVWVGEVDGVGFHERGHFVHLGGMATAVSIFSFCFCMHAVLPTLINSMKDRSQSYKVLLVSFVASTIVYGSMAILGYMMFGEYLMSQITLNLPTKKISTKIAIYTTIINPLTKYAVVITPIANAIEDKSLLCKRRPIAILMRSTIVVSTVLIALFIPFFGYIMAFIGAFLNVAISLLFPCLCYLKINKAARRFGFELIIIIAILLIGSFIGILGTYISVRQIVNQLKSS
ncbi:amino acid transporter AVT1I-like [Gastrolobium bilobum]|uniref:amino acid transporter AVT1I-like n=1 Tax=Gastrolobium bilobum TaxID=150636 RepID=UPI002AB2009F|nr:amino acid transporter AVT1I-like [Gastrolobium bilobum]